LHQVKRIFFLFNFKKISYFCASSLGQCLPYNDNYKGYGWICYIDAINHEIKMTMVVEFLIFSLISLSTIQNLPTKIMTRSGTQSQM